MAEPSTPGGENVRESGNICLVCSKSFLRGEHMRRHMLSHTREKPFSCDQCGKAFARNDVLRRHQSSHVLGDELAGSESNENSRACSNCATARVKCSRGTPCTRCRKKILDCGYPNKRQRSRTKSIGEVGSTRNSYEAAFAPLASPPSSNPEASSHQLTNTSETTLRNPTSSRTFSQQLGIGFSVVSPGRTVTGNGTTDNQDSTSWYTPQVRSQFVLTDMINTGDSVSEFNTANPVYEDAFISPSMNWLPLDLASYDEPDFNSAFFYRESVPDMRQHRIELPEPVTTQVYGNHLVNSSPPAQQLLSTGKDDPLNMNTIDVAGTPVHSLEGEPIPGSSQASPSTLYVDGAGARTTKYREIPARTPNSFEDELSPSYNRSKPVCAQFPDLDATSISNFNSTQLVWLERASYEEIVRHFELLCLGSSQPFALFGSNSFPNFAIVNCCIDLYFKQLHASFPVLHRPTYSENSNWLLNLAVAATGAVFLDTSQNLEVFEAFQEFLRRAVLLETEKQTNKTPAILLAQASLLNVVGFSQIYDFNQCIRSAPLHAALVVYAREQGLLREPDQVAQGFSDAQLNVSGTSFDWLLWVKQENHRRIGYAIWVLDCTLAYQQSTKPILNLNDELARLPCHEDLWEAETPEVWIEASRDYLPPQNLRDTVQDLYLGKKSRRKSIVRLGELSHVVLVHALYQKTWEIGNHCLQPLSNWNPTAHKSSSPAVFVGDEQQWLPAVPIFNKWRNSACDCLDSLHWHANSLIAQASGLEHHVVLHLHIARVILLVPFQDIIRFVNSLISETVSKPGLSENCQESAKVIWRWLCQDHHKARLAVIHAGVVFWHIRRYSLNSFYEPFALFLASITLWAYGSYHHASLNVRRDLDSAVLAGETPASTNEELSTPHPTYIQIDRPADDEIVQLFVKEGTMEAKMNGVGNICDAQGPARVLTETRKLLKMRLWSWGSSHRYHDTLMNLGGAT